MADEKRKGDFIEGGPSQDGVDRRGFLKCMAWAGTGLVWTLSGGIPTSRLFGATGHEAHHGDNGFSFVQISDSHIGFNKGANPDVTGTFQAAIDKINSLPAAPDLIIHTGDLSQISKPGEFDTVDQVLRGAKAKQVFYVPGEHDFAVDNGQQFLQRYGKGTKGAGWQSIDHTGVHLIALVNVANLKAGGMGSLGADQLEWEFLENRQIPIPERRIRSVVETTNQFLLAVSLSKRPFGAVGEGSNGLGLST